MAVPRKMQKNLKRLLDERDRLRAELAAITANMNGKISGIETAISLLQSEDEEVSATQSDRLERGSAKALLLTFLEEVGTNGLNATIAEEMARRRNQVLKRGTAASNLSRLKADCVVVHDGDRYRLPKFLSRQPGLIVIPGAGS